MKRLNSIEDLEVLRQQILEQRKSIRKRVRICGGPGCHSGGGERLIEAFQKLLDEKGVGHEYMVTQTGCHGFCARGPIVVIEPANIFYERVKVERVPEIFERSVLGDDLVDDLLFVSEETGEKIVREKDIPFYAHQERIIFNDTGLTWSTEIDDYIARGGYSALAKVLSGMKPEEVIEEVKISGLRGRGGGGFPTGVKWESCRKAHGEMKYVICNADEGDPGAYMDRALLEGTPHQVIEGMIIGAYAIGAREGYLYCRYEYPLAVKHANRALDQAREYGLLGDNILGTEFCLDMFVNRGAGAFICGESTALMASLEGKLGEPRGKHIHTVEKGLWNRPSNLNNVESWASVPLIVNQGGQWFASIGTERSKGTKIFSVVGKINNTGLVEVAMGTPLRKIVYDIGGGIPGGKRFKAVQTGGPSGGCVPEELIDLAVDFEQLKKAGSMMGSGGMIVMDEDTCMVDVARYFLNFLVQESCGKCVPCRVGVKRMHEIVSNMCEGKAEPGDIEHLEELCDTIQEAALCGLGKSAPNPVASTLRYFRDEYDAHVLEKRCPAKVCKPLLTYEIDTEKCTGCGLCRLRCPEGAIIGAKKECHCIDEELCVRCGICIENCKFGAIYIE
ncbi:NADH-quinone oxidoreductase subunit NuoF [Desulfoferrobacter suflitae]|uniref:NADH-quinone oxidoreductase subunit NuoF n=1 Tax=Desulfoferrobacter suflitae TaxID=2865782 RepID=UPI0021649C6D|nr:NADH-quinone oxidoreductase subunit NuoF [Desulfoferrobacter suflitae]MCK8602020.1 NADH-quinone oxidoreductase subunit NuoF [Desulfoferrobacter suflitae]